MGIASLVFGLIAVANVVFIWVVSLTSFTPGDMIVFVSSVVGLVSWFVTIMLGYTARQGAGRTLGLAGLALDLVALIGFIGLLNIAG